MNFEQIERDFLEKSYEVKPERWHGVDVSKMSGAVTHELLNYSCSMDLPSTDLDYYRRLIEPNLPWADDHFIKERVYGDPINPGKTWQYWVSPESAKHLLNAEGQFAHSYAERYFPRFAGKTPDGYLPGDKTLDPHRGIRWEYGDLETLVDLLIEQPLCRQAYLPIWFPEDLCAAVEHARVPCSLGYHFIVRNGKLHCTYYLRSCDYARHFRDDVYLTIRLLLWVLEQCQLGDQNYVWDEISPGTLTVHITSFHLFKGDYDALYQRRNADVDGASSVTKVHLQPLAGGGSDCD